MNPDSTDNRFARDRELAQLHEALTRPDGADHRDTSEAETDERAVAALLPALDAGMLSPIVQRYITGLLIGGENPSPSTRQKLVEAASRGVRKRHANHAALPALLEHKRHEAGILVAEVADALQISVEDAYRLESGNFNVRHLDAEQIAKWIRIVRVDPETAVSALQHVLQLSTTSRPRQAAGRRGSRALSDADQRLIDAVASLLIGEEH